MHPGPAREVHEVVLREVRVGLDLQHRGFDARRRKVELIQAKVMELQDQNAYSRDEARPEEIAAAKKARKDGGGPLSKKARREEGGDDAA